LPAAPPRSAIRLLSGSLPAAERDAVIGDLTELFADRIDARRPFNRLWFWANACAFRERGSRRACVWRRRSAVGRQLMGRFNAGFKHAMRRLRHEWRFTLAVVFILSVGIGPAAAMLSVFERVLLRPLDYYEPERLGLMRIDIGQLHAHPGLSPAEAIDLRTSQIFESVETETRLTEVSLGQGPEFTSLSQLAFTTGMLPMLGVRPAIGRNFEEADMPLPAPQVPRPADAPPLPPPPPVPGKAMLDYGAWQKHFSGDRAAVGRTIYVNGRPTEIIGVLPQGFRLVTGRAVPQPIDIYLPLRPPGLSQRVAVSDAGPAEARDDVRSGAGRARPHRGAKQSAVSTVLRGARPLHHRPGARRHDADHQAGAPRRCRRGDPAARHCLRQRHRARRRAAADARARYRHPVGDGRDPERAGH
jgi:hypothetical protein